MSKTARKKPLTLFFLYHEQDAEYKKKISNHLVHLRRSGLIELKGIDNVMPGQNRESVVVENIARSAIILFLVSANSVASEIWEKYILLCISYAEKQQAIFIPVLTKAYSWEKTELGNFEPLPANKKSLDDEYWKNTDDAFVEISEKIQKLCEAIIKARSIKRQKQQGELNPEFKQLELSFSNSPDIFVMSHPKFIPGQPLTKAVFSFYQQQFETIRIRMLNRRHNFSADNIEDINEIISMLKNINDRMMSQHSSFLSKFWMEVGSFIADAEKVKLNIANPEYEDPTRMPVAIGRFIIPFCQKIELFEKKFSSISKNSILDQFEPPNPN